MPGKSGKNNFQAIQFLKGNLLISFPSCKTTKSSLVMFILKVNACNNRKKLNDAETIVGQIPILRKSNIKLSTIKIIGSWNDGEIVIESSDSDLLIINLSK